MATSIWIAKLLGPVVLAVAIPMLVSAEDMLEVARQFLKDRALIFASGVSVMVVGLAIVNSHNVWIADWPVIVTLFGWAMIIGGAFRVVLPNVVIAMGDRMAENPGLMRVAGVVLALLGAFVTYEGYFAAA
jgi:hypothetical protein